MKQSFFKKIGMIAFLIVLLVIPLRMILDMIQERSYRNHQAYREIEAIWGAAQHIVGPVLTIPYYDGDGKTGYAYVLPDILNIHADLMPEKRYRGIFEVIVYRSDISLKGTFPRPDFSRWGIEDYQVDWDGAALTLGLNGLRGVQEVTAFQWNDSPVELRPGEGRDDGLSGLTGFIETAGEAEADRPDSFRISLSVHGSREMSFGPAAGTTGVTVNSSW
ncbi:MAG: cell envelope integrity protein CreD, partial [Desulfobacterales bacterium]|nr:cell envelope integrity protein CreD [Desulfobacterales bacterium]